MRTLGLVIVALLGTLASPVLAQSAYDGPLAAPDAPAAATTAPLRRAKPKPKKIRHTAAKPSAAKQAADDAFGAPAATASEAEPPVRKSVAEDPLSLGMKWNGNNDSVAQTRSQNLDGNAFGSGAEVGMKLHF